MSCQDSNHKANKKKENKTREKRMEINLLTFCSMLFSLDYLDDYKYLVLGNNFQSLSSLAFKRNCFFKSHYILFRKNFDQHFIGCKDKF